ncbi:MAG: hypothetical protein M1818_003043 [Claussenomyces sp. TS43310]|nr:MAG: hypothetical protein M1818_003043 [Claussenomyces sp. TS43310]
MSFDLTKYKVLSFDIYATLIDWENGIYHALVDRLGGLPVEQALHEASDVDKRKLLLGIYHEFETQIEREQPTLSYDQVLGEAYTRIAKQFNISSTQDKAESFGKTIGEWLPFPDTVAAMQILGERYKLIALSNVDKRSFNRTLSGPLQGVRFDGIYTAEDIGTYKPDLNNFKYLVEHARQDFGAQKTEILHVAQSLTHDHVPAKEFGLAPGVWIEREGKEGAMGGDRETLEHDDKINLAAAFETLGDMAEAVDQAFKHVSK